MVDVAEEIRCLVAPLADKTLLVPNTCVAEIARYVQPAPVDGGPDWLLGEVEWRGTAMALVSFEALIGDPVPAPGPRARIAVFNRTASDGGVAFWGMLVQDIPRLQRVTVSDLGAGDDVGVFTMAETSVQGAPMVVPDIEAIEQVVGKIRFE